MSSLRALRVLREESDSDVRSATVSNMKCLNLIPAPRRAARARQARIRTWSVALGAYALAAAAGYVACYAYPDTDQTALLRDTRAVTEELRDSSRQMRTARNQVAETAGKVAIARSVRNHPDWSLLLAMLADSLADQIVLERCALLPVDPPPAAGGGAGAAGPAGASPAATPGQGPRAFRFDLAGLARSQTAVSQFVLRLEKARVFDEVRLVQTSRKTFLKADAVAFQLECSLTGKKEAKP
jgi:Tfp pilus assembly protein PilN